MMSFQMLVDFVICKNAVVTKCSFTEELVRLLVNTFFKCWP